MAQVSAGCVVTREGPHGTEVLLVHPRRATFKRPLFGIPKGLLDLGEEPAAAARRETYEETGLHVQLRGPLGTIRQKSGKIVHGFWASVAPQSAGDIDAQGRCRAHDAENDVCRFYPLDQARQLMIPAQREFLDRLRPLLDARDPA